MRAPTAIRPPALPCAAALDAYAEAVVSGHEIAERCLAVDAGEMTRIWFEFLAALLPGHHGHRHHRGEWPRA